jgi:hypothetical protein
MGIHESWSEQEFGQAALGDLRRSRRAVQMGATMSRSPGGQVSAVFLDGKTREAAYRFVRNEAIDSAALLRSSVGATVQRCWREPVVFAPLDATSFNLPDPDERRGMGAIGTHGVGAQGLHLMSGIVVDMHGVPVGLCGQRYWARQQRVGLGRDDYDRRDIDQKETRYWLEVLEEAQAAFAAGATGTRPFFQLDRGGDAWPVLTWAVDHQALLTTRVTHNRRVGDKKKYLWPTVAAIEPQVSYVIDVPEGPNRTARRAFVHVQFCPVEVDVKDRRSGIHRKLSMWAVRVYEIDTAPRGEERIEWMLLTTWPVHTVEDALFVVRGYTTRWRIEEFHKTLKSGACRLEDTMLHCRENVVRFAVLSSSVAIHLQRLLHLSRVSPDEPATVMFTRPEIDATILLRKPAGFSVGDTPSISLVARWIADIGGFMGPAQSTIRKAIDRGESIRLPGAIVLRRGLERVLPVASLLSDGAVKL